MADLTDEELQRVYCWVDSIQLSRPKRNISRDFADGGTYDGSPHFSVYICPSLSGSVFACSSVPGSVFEGGRRPTRLLPPGAPSLSLSRARARDPFSALFFNASHLPAIFA